MPISPAGSFFPNRLSQYVPKMKYHGEVNLNGVTRISFGAPALAAAAAILSAQSINTAVTVEASGLLMATMDAPWGRNLTVVASGAATSNVTINGWDYLGQPMTESFTLNGTNSVVGVKCFKRIRNIVCGLTSSTTINVGTGALLGLPWKAMKVISEEEDNAPKGTLGALTAPVLTNPQTATTGDPRGRYTPNTTLNGTRVVTASFIFDNTVDASGGGGLHGIPHYSA